MRLALTLLIAALIWPLHAAAWTFTPGLICRLSHATPVAEIELTYDPSGPLYSVTVSQANPLPQSRVFSMRFIGPAGRTISTDRHSFSDGGRAVTAQDRGFGNVLDGLQFNDMAEAILGDTILRFPLDGAAEPTEKFRKCEVAAGA
ncbi:MAG: hypothetical protein AAF340_17490 [Pseudomonadota bacterium]